MYEIKTVASIEEVDKGNIAEINIYNWDGEYRPRAEARLCYIPGEGFILKMEAFEKNPRAEHTEQNSRVCDDSCLEFFASFDLSRPNYYLNCECNANGALLCCCGTTCYPRKLVVDMGQPQPEAKPFTTAESWGYTLFLPMSLLKVCFGISPLQPGDHICGSFYKCGDKTEQPHFGSYTKIAFERPNFHLPETFCDMVIVEKDK